MALFDLSALLGVAREGPPARRALVIRRGQEPIGFVLDRVIGQQEAVLRPVFDPLLRVPGISAITDLGDGRPVLVLDLGALVTNRPRRPTSHTSPSGPPGALTGVGSSPPVTIGPGS